MSEEFTQEQIRQVLDLELDDYHGHRTVRAYLLALLRDVWNDGEGFNGKRPFGNSGWDYDIKVPMLKAGIISGKLDSDGYAEQLDDRTADALVLAAMAALDAPREQDAPGSEPAKVVVVTEVRGGIVAERRYRAASWDRRSDGGLDISREPRSTVDTKWVEGIVGAYHKHGWLSVREEGAEVPDSTKRALEIAGRALTEIVRRSNDGGEQPFGRPEIGTIAADALNSIWNETEA